LCIGATSLEETDHIVGPGTGERREEAGGLHGRAGEVPNMHAGSGNMRGGRLAGPDGSSEMAGEAFLATGGSIEVAGELLAGAGGSPEIAREPLAGAGG
jgi:hypothetical protein